MERIPSAEPERAGLNRRGFLAAGAMAAIGSTLLPEREVLAGESEAGSLPTVERVFPLGGAEGDSLFVVGEGFSADPASHWIVLGGGSARVEVVHASRHHLVGVIGPIIAPGGASVEVFTGAPARPRETVSSRNGVRSVAVHRRLSGARAATATTDEFRLLRRSPYTADGALSSPLAIELGAGPARAYRGARVDLWASDGVRHSVEVEVAAGTADPEAFARHLADHLRGLGSVAPSARGSRLVLASSGPAALAGAAEWTRIDLRTSALTRRGPWYSRWSGRLG